MTLVLDSAAAPVRLLWAQFDPLDLVAAKEALATREGIKKGAIVRDVGSWVEGSADPALIPGLSAWAVAQGVDAVVWTALPPRFDKFARPSVDDVLKYLFALTGSVRDQAEKYVRRAPRQIDTEYRRRIEAQLGWTPIP